MGLSSKVEEYKDFADCRFVLRKVYTDNDVARLEIMDLLLDIYHSEDFESFLKTNSDENVWYILDLLSDNDDFKYIIEDIIFSTYGDLVKTVNEDNRYCWDVCEGFASEKDFWNWKEGI